MESRQNTRRARKPSPKRGGGFTNKEMLMMAAFVANRLEETIDAVFLAAVDDGFLTPDRIHELLVTQGMARAVSEAAARQSFGGGSHE